MENVSYDQATLEKLQAVELDILKVVHEFCVRHDIKYSLAYGTLIGAARHKGFIPWDDDVDLMMTREMYDKFIEKWTANPVDGYFLQTDENDPLYPNNFLKIRKENTTFIQEYDDERCYPRCSIFLDIFPFDRVAPEGIRRKKQYYYCLINMLLTRNHVSGKKGAFGFAEKMILGLPQKWKSAIKKGTKRYIEKWNGVSLNEPLFCYCTFEEASRYFPHNLFDEYTEVAFEDKKFSSILDYDEALKISFGDYMILPPENERKTHRPILIDFEKNSFTNKK